MPFLSGRDWRIRDLPKEDIWMKYVQQMTCRYPHLRFMGYTSFWKHFDNFGDSVHFLKVMKHCPICNAYEHQNNLEVDDVLTTAELKLIRDNPTHAEDIKAAYRFYQHTKAEVVATKSEDTLIIVQDFSQFHVGGAFYQLLIIVTYHYDPEKDMLVHKFHHFLRPGPKTNSNDKFFVWSVWTWMMENDFLTGPDGRFRKFLIFSDGCGKHHKSKECHCFWMSLKKKYDHKIDTLDYNYFKSNHANNVADLGSAQGKQTVKYYEIRHQRVPIEGVNELAAVLNMRRNHVATIVDVYYEEIFSLVIRPFKAMRKNHRFVLDSSQNTVTTYFRSEDEALDGKEPNEVFTYNNEELEGMEQIIDRIIEYQNNDGVVVPDVVPQTQTRTAITLDALKRNNPIHWGNFVADTEYLPNSSSQSCLRDFQAYILGSGRNSAQGSMGTRPGRNRVRPPPAPPSSAQQPRRSRRIRNTLT